MLIAIWQRGRRYGERARDWYAFIFIALLTLAYYIAVEIDKRGDFMVAGDVSSFVRLAAIIALVIYVVMRPRDDHHA